MRLTSPRDEAVARPVLQPTLQSVGLQSGEVRVSAVSVDATRGRVDQPVFAIPDSVDVDISGVLQRESRAQSGSGLPLRGGGGGGGRCGLWYFCGRMAGLYVPEWC